MKLKNFIFVVTILFLLFGSFVVGIMGTVIGLSFMISTWYLDRDIINEIKDLELSQETIFETDLFESIINNLKQSSDSVSELYVIGYVTFIVSIIVVSVPGIILFKFRRDFEGLSGSYLRLKLSATQLTIIFSIMFAISLIFISSLSFMIISKNQTILLFISNLISIEDSTKSLLLLEELLISSRFEILVNVFNASFFALLGISMLFAKIIQFLNNEKVTLVSEGYIFASFFLLLFWIPAFLGVIGIDPAPSLSNPVGESNLFENSDIWFSP